MDQLDHDIVQDLLPLYHDGVCSDKSRAAVEEHLQTCEACRAALTAMDAPLPEVEKAADDAAVAVKKISGEWKRGKRRAHIIGVIVAVVVCAAAAVGIWTLTTWTCIPMDGGDYTLDVYRLKSGGVGVHWDFREGRETWYALTFREEADGLHYYLERPILRVELFDFDSNYNRGGDAMFESWSDDALETEAIYFGLGEDAVLLWKEGEEVDLPAATAAQEEMWAIAELPPQEVPQEGEKMSFQWKMHRAGRVARGVSSVFWPCSSPPSPCSPLCGISQPTGPMMFTWRPCGPSPGGGRLRPSRGAARMGRVTTVMWPGLDFSIGRGIWGLACRT